MQERLGMQSDEEQAERLVSDSELSSVHYSGDEHQNEEYNPYIDVNAEEDEDGDEEDEDDQELDFETPIAEDQANSEESLMSVAAEASLQCRKRTRGSHEGSDASETAEPSFQRFRNWRPVVVETDDEDE